MSFVRQICDGYNKTALIGNWNEQRQYPRQQFRESPHQKKARPVQPSIVCYDQKGFQRPLPRLQRRTKWETNRLIVDDGFKQLKSRMQLDYPSGQIQSYKKPLQKPTDRNNDNIRGTFFNPYAQHKQTIKEYKVLNPLNMKEVFQPRQVPQNKSQFRSTFNVHHPNQHRLFAQTTYGASYSRGRSTNAKYNAQQTQKKAEYPAGGYTSVKQSCVKPITSLYCQNKKQTNDLKQDTHNQRSWLPFKDRSLSYSIGRTTTDFAFKALNKNDIQTNTNINIGIHNLHPKETEIGFFRHVRQEEITHAPNKILSSK